MVRSRTGSVHMYHARRRKIAFAKSTVASLIGKPATAAYVAVIALGAVACGIVVNLIPDALPSTMQSACCAAKDAPTLLQQAAAVFLAAMMAYNLARPFGMAPATPVATSAGRG